MLQTKQVTPLIQSTIPALTHVSFRLPLDVCSSSATPAAAAVAAGTALLTSMGNLLTRPRRSQESDPGTDAGLESAQSTVSRHVHSAQGTVSAQSAVNLSGGEGVSAMQTMPINHR